MDVKTSLSIFLFVVIFIGLNWYKPSFIFDTDGTVREFGIGRKKKTIIPLWLIVFITAFLSYLTINTLSQRGMLDM